ncbi:MAG: murein biosynthesis integral membrane protein MurJ [Bacillota bacterium]
MASAGVVMSFSIVSKVLGFVRDMVIAAYYGAARVTDAFMVAQTLPQTLIGNLGGALGTGVLPIVTELKVQGREDDARVVASTILNLGLALSIAVALVAALAAGPLIRLIAPGLSPETAALAARLSRILLASFVFVGGGLILGLLLNSLKDFAVPALNPVLVNIGTIAVVVLLARRLGIYAVVYGYSAGTIVQFALQAWWLRHRGLPPGLTFDLSRPAVRRAIKLALPILAGAIVGGLYVFVDNWLASHLAEGSISAKSFALKLIGVPVGLLTTAISTVIFPTLAERAARHDEAGLADTVAFGLRAVALVTIPASVGLAILRLPIVRVLFQRGAWDERASLMTAGVVLYYAIGVLAVTANPVLGRAFQGMQDTVTPFAVGAFTAVVNIVLDLALIGPLGLVGLPLANSVAVFASLAAYYVLLNRRVHGIPHAKLGVSLLKIAASTAFMGVVVSLALPLAERVLPSTSLAVGVLKLAVLIALGGVAYLIGLIVVRLDEVRFFGKLVSRLAHRA